MKENLTIVAWDDPRCVQPLEAAARIWKERNGQAILITRRPLTDFNDQSLAELAPICDLMIIDYPHVAQALHDGAIISIDTLIAAENLSGIAAAAVGGTQESFIVDGRHTALACDAACHVSAYRPALLEKLGMPVPLSWEAVFALGERAPGAVALALYPTDVISCLMSLTAGCGGAPDGGARLFPDFDIAVEAVARLAALAAIVDAHCWKSTPQALYKWATEEEAVAYIPFTFGYSRITRAEQGGWRFGAPPQKSGSLLGGAGMAVSSQTAVVQDAAAFAEWYCGAEGQRIVGRNWGQPACRLAWEDAAADDMTAGFFSATRATQELAYVRPRAVWWPAVQKETGTALAKMLQADEMPADIVAGLERIYGRLRCE